MIWSNGRKLFDDYSENVVPGDGPIPCDVMIIGEAPGRDEDAAGRPFIGKAGQRLDEALEAAGLARSDCYVTNVVKRRPPNNRKPRPEEIAAYWYYLANEMVDVQPKFILLLGNTALYALTKHEGITSKRGRVMDKMTVRLDCTSVVYATFHPSATFRSRETKDTFFKDINTFGKIVRGSYTVAGRDDQIIDTED